MAKDQTGTKKKKETKKRKKAHIKERKPFIT